MRLSGMVNSLEARSELAREQGLTPAEFLALLLDDEIERRHNAKIARREKAASAPGSGFGGKPTGSRIAVVRDNEFSNRHQIRDCMVKSKIS